MSATAISAKWAPGTSTKSTPLSEARASVTSPDGELSVEGEEEVLLEAGAAGGTGVAVSRTVSASADAASATTGTSAATVDFFDVLPAARAAPEGFFGAGAFAG